MSVPWLSNNINIFKFPNHSPKPDVESQFPQVYSSDQLQILVRIRLQSCARGNE
jgi:hypothetical protein